MPVLNLTTKTSRETWKSPDGKITAYEIVADVNGQELKTETYSKQIAEVGWSGEVETYEKNGRTYVKQPQREDSGGKSYGGGSKSYSKPVENPHTMYLSYAKDVLVALLAQGKKFDPAEFQGLIAELANAGNTLYASRPGAETAKVADVPENQMEILNKVFPLSEETTVVEDALWGKVDTL